MVKNSWWSRTYTRVPSCLSWNPRAVWRSYTLYISFLSIMPHADSPCLAAGLPSCLTILVVVNFLFLLLYAFSLSCCRNVMARMIREERHETDRDAFSPSRGSIKARKGSELQETREGIRRSRIRHRRLIINYSR